MAAAGLGLRRRQGDPDAARASAADEVEQRPPAAAEVEHPPPGPDPDLLATYSCLRRCASLEAEREVAVVLGAAEVRQLTQAEPEDAVDQRVGELEVVAIGHGLARASAKVTSRPRRSSQSLNRTARRPSHSESVGTSWKIGFWSWARCRL